MYRHLVLKSHQLSIDAFVSALRWMEVEDVDSDEAQCLLANLIYEVYFITYQKTNIIFHM